MEEYPEELHTPPVTLVSMVGFPDLHPLISTFLLSQQPPINTLALPDLSKIHLFHKKNDPDVVVVASAAMPPPSSPFAILKRDWFLKHCTKIPVVLAALFPSHLLLADPAQWLQLCSDLDSIKSVIRGKNIKLVVIVVVRTNPQDEISEDKMIALQKRAKLEAKYVVVLNPNDDSELQLSLNRLGNTFSELAGAYYREEGRRVKQRIEKKNVSFVELMKGLQKKRVGQRRWFWASASLAYVRMFESERSRSRNRSLCRSRSPKKVRSRSLNRSVSRSRSRSISASPIKSSRLRSRSESRSQSTSPP